MTQDSPVLPPKYHIYYRVRGQRGSALESLTCTNAAGGFASGPFVRNLWDTMKNGLFRHGHMVHPDTEQVLEFASLHTGGYVVNNTAMGGQMCQKWEKGMDKIQFIFEPEPDLYSAQAKMLAAQMNEAPEQPEPSYEMEVAVVDEPIAEEVTANKKPKRTKRETKAEV